jgi:UDP-glucose 4-epimerase
MPILVVGGAGYIGSHAVRALVASGHGVWVFDDLSQGHAASVPAGRLLHGNLADRDALELALRTHQINAVMHFAAFASVPESVADPAKYYRNNLVGTLNLLDAMRAVGVGRIVFSSTAAVYGVPEVVPIPEDSPRQPINPYGFTKLAMEHALADYARAYGLGYAVLRYFNACGAAGDGTIGEDHTPETHLIPLALQVALGQREAISIFGTDYPTPDGTCVRDYIHVEDLADAHIRVLDRIEPGRGLVYNVGTGTGVSVREVVDACRRATGHPIPAVEHARRPGDPSVLVAASQAIQRDLGWSPRYTRIDEIVASAWNWHKSHPRGYASRAGG